MPVLKYSPDGGLTWIPVIAGSDSGPHTHDEYATDAELSSGLAGKENTGVAAAADAAHVAAADPHTQYLTDAEADAKYATDVDVSGKVAKTGDSMTGDLVIDKANPFLILDKDASTQQNCIIGKTNNVFRWNIRLGDITAESGADAGTDLVVTAYSDTGINLGNPLTIKRSTGLATVKADPTTGLGISTKQYTDGKVAKTGDTMSGPLDIDYSGAALNLKGAQTAVPRLNGYKDGLLRWQVRPANSTADTGSNAGSNFDVVPYADDGTTALPLALRLYRNSSLAIVAGDPTTALGIATKQYVDRMHSADDVTFTVGVLNWVTTSTQTAYLVMSTGTGMTASVRVELTGSWNNGNAAGRHVRESAMYWNGSGTLTLAEDATTHALEGSGISLGYSVGAPTVVSNTLRWPIYKLRSADNSPISVTVTVTAPDYGNSYRSDIISRFSLINPVNASHGQSRLGAVPWTTPALSNGWGNGAYARPIQYRRFLDGTVMLRGHALGPASANVDITTLPLGFRPFYTSAFMVPSGAASNFSTLNVYDTGRVALSSPNYPNSSFLAVDGVTYLAEV